MRWYRTGEVLDQKLANEGWVKIEETRPGVMAIAHPAYTCLKPLRNGKRCLMDQGHRGRHTSVVHTCDVCDKTRRGEHPYRYDAEQGIGQCFFCCEVDNPYKRRARKKVTNAGS